MNNIEISVQGLRVIFQSEFESRSFYYSVSIGSIFYNQSKNYKGVHCVDLNGIQAHFFESSHLTSNILKKRLKDYLTELHTIYHDFQPFIFVDVMKAQIFENTEKNRKNFNFLIGTFKINLKHSFLSKLSYIISIIDLIKALRKVSQGSDLHLHIFDKGLQDKVWHFYCTKKIQAFRQKHVHGMRDRVKEYHHNLMVLRDLIQIKYLHMLEMYEFEQSDVFHEEHLVKVQGTSMTIREALSKLKTLLPLIHKADVDLITTDVLNHLKVPEEKSSHFELQRAENERKQNIFKFLVRKTTGVKSFFEAVQLKIVRKQKSDNQPVQRPKETKSSLAIESFDINFSHGETEYGSLKMDNVEYSSDGKSKKFSISKVHLFDENGSYIDHQADFVKGTYDKFFNSYSIWISPILMKLNTFLISKLYYFYSKSIAPFMRSRIGTETEERKSRNSKVEINFKDVEILVSDSFVFEETISLHLSKLIISNDQKIFMINNLCLTHLNRTKGINQKLINPLNITIRQTSETSFESNCPNIELFVTKESINLLKKIRNAFSTIENFSETHSMSKFFLEEPINKMSSRKESETM